MASFVFNDFKANTMNGTIDLDTDTIKVALVDATFDGTLDDGPALSNITTLGELSGTGYTGGWGGAGRKTLASAAVAVDDVNDRASFDAADVTWTAINAGTINGAVIFKDGAANDTTSYVIAFIDLANTTTNGGDITIQWGANGILLLT